MAYLAPPLNIQHPRQRPEPLVDSIPLVDVTDVLEERAYACNSCLPLRATRIDSLVTHVLPREYIYCCVSWADHEAVGRVAALALINLGPFQLSGMYRVWPAYAGV